MWYWHDWASSIIFNTFNNKKDFFKTPNPIQEHWPLLTWLSVLLTHRCNHRAMTMEDAAISPNVSFHGVRAPDTQRGTAGGRPGKTLTWSRVGPLLVSSLTQRQHDILITAEAEVSSIYSEKYQAEGDKKIETFFSIDPSTIHIHSYLGDYFK